MIAERHKNFIRVLLIMLTVCSLPFIAAAQKISAPKDVLGFTPGDDRKLASWNQVIDYFQKLAAASDRVKFQEIGKTTLGNPFVYATISSPANLKNLEKYKQIQAKLADPRLIKSNDATAKKLIAEGKTIVLITCGVHSNEVGSYLSSMLIADKLANATDAETLKILDNTIILLVPSLNPDGVDIIKNWYDKTLGTPFEGTDPPELYHKYVGHDDNRDWYAFTQVETQLTVDKIHNVWHPQIVHDIHQQGSLGARLFIPPYLPPVEPNVPKELVEGYTELGNYMAKDLRAKGFSGITTDSTYDAWTPSRAYSHYHAGVRILSETASCKLATPINIKFEDLRNGLGYDPKKETANFSPVWRGGEWHIRDITNYMTTAAFALLQNASDNRERWLSRFYAIGKEAVRPRKDGELFAYTFDSPYISSIFEKAGLKVDYGNRITINGKVKKGFTYVVRMKQPYGAFAKALLENQKYPNLKDEKGNPIPPYDVTAYTLSLLYSTLYYPKVTPVYSPFRVSFYTPPEPKYKGGGIGMSGADYGCTTRNDPIWVYRSYVPAIDEGWTRWVIEKYGHNIENMGHICTQLSPIQLTDEKIRENAMQKGLLENASKYKNKTIIFPDQSTNQILNGFPKGAMPDEYTGGVGKDGVENLKKFVEAGGTLVFLNRTSRFAIQQFGLPVRDVTERLPRKEFYIPGSILRTELDTTNPIAKGMANKSIAWFEDSPAFEVSPNRDTTVSVIAKYPNDPKDVLLSGYALGAEKIAGKAALVSVSIGKGKIILFGFRPQYRGQSLATFPLLFNAIQN